MKDKGVCAFCKGSGRVFASKYSECSKDTEGAIPFYETFYKILEQNKIKCGTCKGNGSY